MYVGCKFSGLINSLVGTSECRRWSDGAEPRPAGRAFHPRRPAQCDSASRKQSTPRRRRVGRPSRTHTRCAVPCSVMGKTNRLRCRRSLFRHKNNSSKIFTTSDHSGLVVASERFQDRTRAAYKFLCFYRKSLRTYSFWHVLNTAMSRSTQPSTLRGRWNEYQPHGWANVRPIAGYRRTQGSLAYEMAATWRRPTFTQRTQSELSHMASRRRW